MGRAIVPPAQVLVVPGDRPRPGEIWAFCGRDAEVVVHRLRARHPDGLLFQGDAMRLPDAVVAPDCLIGRVIRIRRDGATRTVGMFDRWWGVAAVSGRRLRRRIHRLRGRPPSGIG